MNYYEHLLYNLAHHLGLNDLSCISIINLMTKEELFKKIKELVDKEKHNSIYGYDIDELIKLSIILKNTNIRVKDLTDRIKYAEMISNELKKDFEKSIEIVFKHDNNS